MGRPAKSASINNHKGSKDEMTTRQDAENKLRGDAVKPEPPEYLTDSQKDIFRFIVNELANGNILGKLDVFVLEGTAVSIDRLRKINERINDDENLLFSTVLQGSRAKYQSDLWRGCNELCLSPQSRAKVGSLVASAVGGKEKQAPLLAVLSDDD